MNFIRPGCGSYLPGDRGRPNEVEHATLAIQQWERATADEVLNRADRPVFLIGIHRRCGSNFLFDALRVYPRFQAPLPLAEDYLLQYAHLLRRYVDRTASEQYQKRFADQPEGYAECRRTMLRALGDGLLVFLNRYIEPGRRLLSKTPDPWGLDLFFDLFPDALLIVMLRDGRDVVESSHRSWPHHSRTYWMQAFAENARTVLRFAQDLSPERRGQVLVVRYEDLLAGREAMEQVLRHLGIPLDEYDWDALDRLPVRGSSVLRGGRKELHWQPVEKPADFRPVGRWHDWSWWNRFQFRRIAGREFEALGYRW